MLQPDVLLNNPVADPALKAQYQALVGLLMYIAGAWRPDIQWTASMLARATSNPTPELMGRALRVVHYLHHTKDMSLTYSAAVDLAPRAMCDADWARHHSTSGWAIWCGGALVAWASKKQQCVALSTTEAEIMAASMACADIMHLRAVLEGFEQHAAVDRPTRLWIDNHSTCCVATAAINTKVLKHMARRWYYVRELATKKLVVPVHVRTDFNISDVLTKALCAEKHQRFTRFLMQSDVAMPDWI